MRSEFFSSPPDPTPSIRTLSVRTLSVRTLLATCVARREEVAPGPSCSPKSGDRASASEDLSGFGQYIRPGLGLLDDALPPPYFQAGPPSTLQTALEFPQSPPTLLHDPASSSLTSARPLPYSRWQLSTPTRREEGKLLLRFEVHFEVADFAILPFGMPASQGSPSLLALLPQLHHPLRLRQVPDRPWLATRLRKMPAGCSVVASDRRESETDELSFVLV